MRERQILRTDYHLYEGIQREDAVLRHCMEVFICFRSMQYRDCHWQLGASGSDSELSDERVTNDGISIIQYSTLVIMISVQYYYNNF